MKHNGDDDTKYNSYSHRWIGKWIGRFGNKRKSGDNPDDSITKIGQNAEKSPGDLRRLAVTQTPVKDHQLMLAWKLSKEQNIDSSNFRHSKSPPFFVNFH